jgi:hypothetical protein
LKPLSGGEERILYSGPASHIEIAPNGKQAAFAWQGKVMLLEFAGGEPQQLASLRGADVLGLAWEPDSSAVLISVPGNPPALWRARPGEPPARLDWSPDRLDGIRLHPDGKRVAFTAGKVSEQVWSLSLKN